MADWKSICNIVLRSLAATFSLIAFALMSAEDYDESDGFLFLLIINVITCAYSLGHVIVYSIYKLSQLKETKEVSFKVIIFITDQLLAYGLLSGAAVAARDVKIVQRIKDLVQEVEEVATLYGIVLSDSFTTVTKEYDTGVGGVVMGVFSFVAVALSALLSGFCLMRILAVKSSSHTNTVLSTVTTSPAENTDLSIVTVPTKNGPENGPEISEIKQSP